MAQATLAIGAPATSAWERCCLGLPSVIIPFADNQLQVAKALENAGAGVVVNPEAIEKILPQAIEELLKGHTRYTQNCLKVCNGLGPNKTMQYLLPVNAKDQQPVRLRDARADDIQQVFAWQSRPETRRYARNPEVPGWDQHQAWMTAKLQDMGCYFYMIEHGGQPAGVIRLDRIVAQRYEVSIFIAPEKYRLGLARIALSLLQKLHRYIDIEAEVLPGNIASEQLFLSSGYVRQSPGKYLLQQVAAKG